MSEQIKIQWIGLSLALATAFAYERLCKSYSYFIVGFLVSATYVPFWVSSKFVQSKQSEPCSKWWVFIFVLSGITGPLWYWLTSTKNVLTGAVFEVKYIAILVLCSVLAGSKEVTVYTVVGAILAMASIYFISK